MFPLQIPKQLTQLPHYIENSSNHWDVQIRDEDGRFLRQLWSDAVVSGVRLSNGAKVQSKSDLIRYIAQQYATHLRTKVSGP